MSLWRAADLSDIPFCKCVRYFELFVEQDDDDEQLLNLFRNKIGPAELNDFIRYIPN